MVSGELIAGPRHLAFSYDLRSRPVSSTNMLAV
jgi:hypothetical protein